ncbi:hypothetical protein GCM10028794_01110 [Silanimonas algicola]
MLLRTVLVVAAVLLATPETGARELRVGIARVDAGAARAETVGIRLRTGAAGADPIGLAVEAARVELPDAALRLERVAWSCERVATLDPLTCDGPLHVGGREAGRLVVDLSAARTRMAWSQGRRSLRVDKDVASPWRVALQDIPLAWLQGLQRQIWADGRIDDGTVSGTLTVPVGDDSTRIDADVRLERLAFETLDGLMAGAGLSMPLRLSYVAFPAKASEPAGVRVSIEAGLRAGELLVTPIYLAVPAGGVDLRLDAESAPDGGWRVSRWAWGDAPALQAEGDARLGPDGTVSALAARWASPDLAALRARYLDGVLAPAGFGELQLAGQGGGAVAFDPEGLSALDVDLREAIAIDPKGRFSLAGIDGGVRWSRDADVTASALGWRAAALYGIGIEAGRLGFRSSGGQLVLAAPLRAGTLGGHLRLDRLVWRPARGEAPLRIEMGLALEALDLGSLSQRLGWPDFEGTLGGTLPNALYERNRVRFEGGLAMQLFGGEVRIDDLALERPFGVAPSLAANLRFQDIDLAPLTGAFGFGEITGRLDGRIRDLRLVDWTPVAFDARLLTDRDWAGPRRISQRAVQDISDLGGSGLVAGMQARLLRTFDDFGYDRIGIGCVLRDNRCAMTGLKKRGDGYVIIDGRGLPRIDVVGFRRSVDWPTLVSRLKDATEGDTLRIE